MSSTRKPIPAARSQEPIINMKHLDLPEQIAMELKMPEENRAKIFLKKTPLMIRITGYLM